MNEFEIRRANLKLIADKFGMGKQLAATLEVDASYLSRMLSGQVNISRGKGAQIESALGLPYKWLERENDVVPKLSPWNSNLKANEPQPAVSYSDAALLASLATLPENIQNALRLIVGHMAAPPKGTK